MKRKWILTTVLVCSLLAPLPAAARGSVKTLTVDACTGGDLHRSFGGINGVTYGYNSVSVTTGGTYPVDPTDFRFGCRMDTPDNRLGDATVRLEDWEGYGAVEEITFNLDKGQIIIKGNGGPLSGNSGCFSNGATVDMPILGGTGAYAGIAGVAHLTAVNPTVCQVRFAPK